MHSFGAGRALRFGACQWVVMARATARVTRPGWRLKQAERERVRARAEVALDYVLAQAITAPPGQRS